MSSKLASDFSPRNRYLRVNQIVAPDGILPISRSCWYAWRAGGRVSKGLQLGPRVVVWPESEVLSLLKSEGDNDE